MFDPKNELRTYDLKGIKPMLTAEILNAVKSYTENMKNAVTLVLKTGEHSKRAELYNFLS